MEDNDQPRDVTVSDLLGGNFEDWQLQRELDELPVGYIDRREEIDAWIAANTDRVAPDVWRGVLDERFQAEPGMHGHATVFGGLKALHRTIWGRYGLLAVGYSLDFGKPRLEVPLWLLEACELIEPRAPVVRRQSRLPIAPAFRAAGREGLGQISSSQISDGLFRACVAPKSEWDRTSTGFPCYRYRYKQTEIAFTLRPEVPDRRDLADEIRQMELIRDDLSVSDWDTVVAMMAQVLREGQQDASASIGLGDILGYRQLQRQRDKEGYAAGYGKKPRQAVAASVRRLSYLWISTETVPYLVREGRRVDTKPLRINEKVMSITKDAEELNEDATVAWQYSFGDWFKTFLSPPNRYIAYQWQKVLAYNPYKQQWAKQLAYYLTIEIRTNANHGIELRRTAGELLNGAKIAMDLRYPDKARDRLEEAIRQVVADGLFRLSDNGTWLSGPSEALHAWHVIDVAKLPARGWFSAYCKQLVTFRADEELEGLYNKEIRRLNTAEKSG